MRNLVFIAIISAIALTPIMVYASYETLHRTDGKQMTIEIEGNYDKITLEEIQEAKERRGLDG